MALKSMPEKSTLAVTLSTISIILLIAGSFFLITNYNKQIYSLNQNISDFKGIVEAEFQLVQNVIRSSQEENQKKFDTISKTIKKIEEESNIKLSELEEELKGISIEAGDFSAIVEDVIKGVVSIFTDKGQGSGAIITSDGFIVTNYHVIRDARIINVVDYRKDIFQASLVGYSENKDIAVLKIQTENHYDLEFADSSKVKIGEKVIALGNPAGLGFSVTEGIVSQLDRVLSPNLPPLIQTDVPINPGNSGGPLINTQGNIIGINELKIAGYESLGFAIPSNTVKQVVEEIINRDI